MYHPALLEKKRKARNNFPEPSLLQNILPTVGVVGR
jgi:hypothetical protein